jgi:hypothetical protein
VAGPASAHAPLQNFKLTHSPGSVADARSAGEFVSATGLACVLLGLRRAPQLERRAGCPTSTTIANDDIIAVVAPATALGSVPVLSAVQRGVPVIAVKSNTTILGVTAAGLALPGVVEVDDYLAAAGAVLALRTGISIESVRRPLATLGAAMAAKPSSSMQHDKRSPSFR